MDDMAAEAKYLNLVRYSRGWKAAVGDIVICNLFSIGCRSWATQIVDICAESVHGGSGGDWHVLGCLDVGWTRIICSL